MRRALCLGLSLLAGAAHAEDAAAPLDVIPIAAEPAQEPPTTEKPRRLGPSTIEEIVVTAQKREESINTVPISISAFSGEDLQALGIKDTRDLANLVPGFSFGDSGYGVPIYSLRGVGFNDPSQTASSTVGVYADEFNLPFPVFTKGANLDVQRVEILKGPQGTLYGRNTTGGLVNYIANRAGDRFEAGTRATYSHFNNFQSESYAGGPLSDSLGLRVAYRGEFSGNGWQYSNTRPDDTLGRQNKHSARALLDWQPNEDFKTALMLSGWLDRGEPQAPQSIGIRPANQTAGQAGLPQQVRDYPTVPFDTDDNRVADWAPDLEFHLRQSFGMVALRNDWMFATDTTLSLLSSYGDFRDRGSVIPQSGLDSRNAERKLTTSTNATSLEARVAGRWLETNNWMFGGFYAHDKVDDFQVIYAGTDSAGFPLPLVLPVAGQLSAAGDRIDSLGHQIGDTYAGFTNADWQFLPAFKLNLGLRYTAEQRDFRGCIADDPDTMNGAGLAVLLNAVALTQPVIRPGTPPPTMFAMRGDCASINPETNNPGEYRGSLSESNLSYRSALNWTPVDDMLYYASYSRGFKSGSFPILPSSSQAQYEPVVQERLDAFELGGKTAFFDKRLRFNVAGFYYDYRDKQLIGRVLDPVFGPLPILVNVPKSKVKGLEAEIQSSPLDGLYLGLNATYLRTALGRYSGIDEAGKARDLTGKPFNFAPKFSATAIVNYTWAVSSNATLGVGTDYSYRGKTNSVLTQDRLYAIKPYRLLNAHVDWVADTGWSLGLFARNITDEFYTVGTLITGDSVARLVGVPRSYGITVSYQIK